VVRFLIALFGVFFCFAGVYLSSRDFNARQVIYTGSRIAAGATLTDKELSQAEGYTLAIDLACRRDIQMAAMSIPLAALDFKRQTAVASEDLTAAYSNALSAIERNLSCFPLNGEAWLRSAMARLLLEGPGPAVLEHVSLSQLTMPNEARLLTNRIGALVALSHTGNQKALDLLENDLVTLFRAAPLSMIRSIYEKMGAYGSDLMRKSFHELASSSVVITNSDRLANITNMLEIAVPRDNCSRYFGRLKTCVGEE
jgi:hypothetical protein